MSENVAKAKLLNYVLSKKHGTEECSNPIIENQIKALNGPNCLLGFRSDFTADEMNEWLANLEDVLPIQKDILQDLIFGILYSSDIFPKLIKSKDFNFTKIRDLYKLRFEINKKYLADFNSKDQGKIKINAPKKIVTRFLQNHQDIFI